jgi:hypothetical protein
MALRLLLKGYSAFLSTRPALVWLTLVMKAGTVSIANNKPEYSIGAPFDHGGNWPLQKHAHFQLIMQEVNTLA